MADGRKYRYMNNETGEVVRFRFIRALIYFWADGRKYGYKFKVKDLKRYN